MADSPGLNDQTARQAAPPPRHRATGEAQLPSAGTPVSSTGLGLLGLLWAVALVALGALVVRDAVVAASWAGGRPWTQSALEALPGMRPDTALLVAATVVGVAGIVLLALALRPRRKLGVPVEAQAGTFIRHKHLSRLVAGRLETLDGVLSAHVRARRRTVNAHVHAVGGIDHADLRVRAQELVTRECTAITTPLRVSVRTREKERD